MSLAKGLFPDKGFSLQERNKTNKQTNQPVPLPSLPPSRLSGVLQQLQSLTHPQQTKLSSNFKKIVLLGIISNFKQLKAKQKPQIKIYILKKIKKIPQVGNLGLLVSLHYKIGGKKNTGLSSPIEAQSLAIVVFLLDLRSPKNIIGLVKEQL